MVREKGLDPEPSWPKHILLLTELDFRESFVEVMPLS